MSIAPDPCRFAHIRLGRPGHPAGASAPLDDESHLTHHLPVAGALRRPEGGPDVELVGPVRQGMLLAPGRPALLERQLRPEDPRRQDLVPSTPQLAVLAP